MYKKIYFSFILILAFVSYSCEDMFEPNDENIINEEFVFNDPVFSEGILLNGYNLIPTFSSVNNALDMATDNAVCNQPTNNILRMGTGELSSFFNPANRWGRYSNILYVNKFLENSNDVVWSNDPTINTYFSDRLKGEALALRALQHFYILQAHAGVSNNGTLLGIPYIDQFIEVDGDFNTPRLSFQETVERINNDFEEAFNLLPYVYTNNASEIHPKDQNKDEEAYLLVNSPNYEGRFCGLFVRAFQAKLNLLAASPAYLNSQDYYRKAAEYAAETINSAWNNILPTDGLTFYENNSSEILWAQPRSNNFSLEEDVYPPFIDGDGGDGRINPSHNLVASFPLANGYPATTTNGLDLQNPYNNRDPRLQAYIVTNGSSISGQNIITGISGGGNRVDSLVTRSTRTGYYLRKHTVSNVSISQSGGSVSAFHYDGYLRATELFLILAEAQNEVVGADGVLPGSFLSAREILAQIRKRPQNPGFVDNYLNGLSDITDLIKNERRIELCFEGARFWDLRRWNLPLNEEVIGSEFLGATDGYQTFSVENRNFQEFARFMPISNSEIQKFSALEQNKGW